ncbi:hypothetical protein E2562_016759 [Oryza meyeriana var. granulata]|uniref:Uncharacterized protein n=1 Tax=Oryza meyeriana var. granulata TaxID=110450 RepID=A0A6G1BL84_9ORYZ|nr:hypothetical protein E2562_016759 [Oryza meyeriana var. granulata]
MGPSRLGVEPSPAHVVGAHGVRAGHHIEQRRSLPVYRYPTQATTERRQAHHADYRDELLNLVPWPPSTLPSPIADGGGGGSGPIVD